mmetsp:Transcript_6194/g.17454  ORF Transcript_6194/g.17454 Transcript_6194/m.17454 type:complete len:207 (-) Transcript_6194:7-627(-)
MPAARTSGITSPAAAACSDPKIAILAFEMLRAWIRGFPFWLVLMSEATHLTLERPSQTGTYSGQLSIISATESPCFMPRERAQLATLFDSSSTSLNVNTLPVSAEMNMALSSCPGSFRVLYHSFTTPAPGSFRKRMVDMSAVILGSSSRSAERLYLPSTIFHPAKLAPRMAAAFCHVGALATMPRMSAIAAGPAGLARASDRGAWA